MTVEEKAGETVDVSVVVEVVTTAAAVTMLGVGEGPNAASKATGVGWLATKSL